MAELTKEFLLGMPWPLYVIIILAFGLLVASFLVPPLGIITPSVLKGAALILAATWLFYVTANIPTIIANGAKLKATYGNASIEIGRKKKQEEKQKENNKRGK